MAGLAGGLLSAFGDIYKGFGDMKGAKKDAAKNLKDTGQYYLDEQEQRMREESLDYDPSYVGSSISPYKRSSSPVARAYLESMMTGQNADSVSNPWSDPLAVAKAKKSFEGTYGAYDDLVARGEQERKETPWRTSNPREISEQANQIDPMTGTYDTGKNTTSGRHFTEDKKLGWYKPGAPKYNKPKG